MSLERPDGTLFFRSGRPGYGPHAGRTLVGLYGLLQLPVEIEGERMYLAVLHRSPEGLALRIDTLRSSRPDPHYPTEHSNLAYLAQRDIWHGGDAAPGMFQIFLRKSGLRGPNPNADYYLAVGVCLAQREDQLPDEVLVDFRDGQAQHEGVACDSIGIQPDQVLQKPFFLTAAGDRRAVVSTTSPYHRKGLRDISRITLVPVDQRSQADQLRLEHLRRDDDFRQSIGLHEGGEFDGEMFVAFKRGMAGHELPQDRLVTAEELRAHDTVAGQLMRQILSEDEREIPVEAPSGPA